MKEIIQKIKKIKKIKALILVKKNFNFLNSSGQASNLRFAVVLIFLIFEIILIKNKENN